MCLLDLEIVAGPATAVENQMTAFVIIYVRSMATAVQMQTPIVILTVS